MAVAAACLCFTLLAAVKADAVGDDSAATARTLTLLEAVGEEYREAVHDGAVVREIEYEEAKTFLADARDRWRTVQVGEGERRVVDTALERVHAAITGRESAQSVAALLAGATEQITTITGVQPDVEPPQSPSAARGRMLFAENCASCHGMLGDGNGEGAAKLSRRPANFTDREFMRRETPYDFFHVVTLGRPGSAMPAWGEVLTIQERWDLISYVWTLATTEARLAEGQGIYLTQCASCHGANGNGQGAWSAALLKAPPDLTRVATATRSTDDQMLAATSDGVAGSPMPGFARTLSADERERAVAFLRFAGLGGVAPTSGDAGDGSGGRGTRMAKLARLLGSSYAEAAAQSASADTVGLRKTNALADQVVDATELLTAGLPATAATELRNVAAEVRTLVNAHAAAKAVVEACERLALLAEKVAPPSVAADVSATAATDIEANLNESTRLLAAAMSAHAKGDAKAIELTSDAYFAFEPVEKRLGGVAPELKSSVEEKFLHLRQALRTPDATAEVQTIVAAIRQDYSAVRAKLEPSSSTGLLLQSAGIILREGFEIVLVIGALLGYVVKAGYPEMRRLIQGGTVVGVIASFATAFAFGELMRLNPGSSDTLEGLTMILAAVVLFWVSYWLISKAEADRWQRYIRSKVHNALAGRRKFALFGAAFLAVYREGFETVLFYQALSGSAPSGSSTIAAGIAIGSVALGLVYVLFRRFQVRLPIGQFFLVTGVFLYAMAAIFAGQGIFELQEVGYLPLTPLPWMPTLPLLGVYPTFETVMVQTLFLGLLMYASLTIWRRTAAARRAANIEIGDELRNLHVAVRELCAIVRATLPEDRNGQIGPAVENLERVTTRLEQLAQKSSTGEVRL